MVKRGLYEGGRVIISLDGRLDTANAVQVDGEIEDALKGCCVTSIAFDCSNLEYISSTGLRLVLKYKKRFDSLEVLNTSQDVYNVFDITGFSRILTVRKALRHVSISGCREIARGGVGIIYRLDEDTIIKVFSKDCPVSIPEGERVMAKESFVLGMPTAIPYDLVWVPETESYGLVFELISAGTLSSAICSNPQKLDYYADMFGNQLRSLHSIHAAGTVLPDYKNVSLGQIERISRHFLPEQVELMKQIVMAIPEGDRLLHNDCHPKNIMMAGDERNPELLLIDMGEVSYGHPLFELSHVYSALTIKDNFEGILGFPKELAMPLLDKVLRTYFKTDDEKLLGYRREQIRVAAVVRTCAWIALSEYPQEVIDGVRAYADEILLPNREYLLGVAETFQDFSV